MALSKNKVTTGDLHSPELTLHLVKVFDQLLELAKEKILKQESPKLKAFDPDFILVNKKYGIYLIDSKNVNDNKYSQKPFDKAINQCRVFKSFLIVLNPEYEKLDFHMGAYLPSKLNK